MDTAWFRRPSTISAGNSASTSTCSGSLRCSYPGLSLSLSSCEWNHIFFPGHLHQEWACKVEVLKSNEPNNYFGSGISYTEPQIRCNKKAIITISYYLSCHRDFKKKLKRVQGSLKLITATMDFWGKLL